MNARFWYLATPYRRYPGGLELATIAAAKYGAELLDRGVNIYSPIVHSHELAKFSKVDPTSDVWLQRELPFMHQSRGLIIAKLPTWDLSKGVRFERGWFEARRRPIFILDAPLPDELPGGLL